MSGVLDRLRLRKTQHRLWGAALLSIFLVSCGSNSPKSEEQKPSVPPTPTPEAPALKKSELGPQPDLGSVIILEVPGEGVQSFHVIGTPGARYLARVTPLYGSSKTKKRSVPPSATPEQAQTGEQKDATAVQEPPKPPQGFTATFFPLAEAPNRPDNFYTAETLKGIKEGRYQLPAPPLPTEAAQATETATSVDPPFDQHQSASEKSAPPTSLPENLWSPVTNKGTETFEVETEVVPSDQNAQPIVLEIKNLDAVPRTVKVVIREKRKP